MMVLNMRILTLSIVLILHTMSASACVWPEWFDIRPSWDLGPTRAWETKTIISTRIIPRINDYHKSRTFIEILTNKTFRMTDQVKEQMSDEWMKADYECVQDLGDFKYILKKEKHLNNPSTYRCMQLIKKSPFVAQWRLGSESATQPQQCVADFAPISEYPLVYFPVRAQHRNKILEFKKVFDKYKGCPSLGGFYFRVYYPNGSALEFCKTDLPSPMLNIGCTGGESITILADKNCLELRSGYKGGAKLYCLANWEDNKYRYSVVAPSGDLHINSFHCLRMDKSDPTEGEALLFLDNVCRTGNPEQSDNYFRMKLRRRPSSGSVCQDLSDTCDNRCEQLPYWCGTTCNKCPEDATPSSVNETIIGKWFRQISGKRNDYVISEQAMTLAGIGKWSVYGDLSTEQQVCIRKKSTFKKNSFGYILGSLGDKDGCGGHVVQVRVKKISDSVLILQNTSPAPLRPDEYIENTEKWCHSNYLDVEKSFDLIFSPFSPIMDYSGVFSSPSGFFTLVNSDKQMRTKCYSGENLYRLNRLSHLKVNIFYYPSKKIFEVEKRCTGEIHVNGEMEDRYKITYQCDSADPVTITYDCLGGYDVSRDYYGLIIKTEPSTTDSLTLPTSDGYYCLMLPTKSSDQDTKPMKFFYTTAGNCDWDFAIPASLGQRRGTTMLIEEYLSGATVKKQWISLIVLSFLCYIYIP